MGSPTAKGMKEALPRCNHRAEAHEHKVKEKTPDTKKLPPVCFNSQKVYK